MRYNWSIIGHEAQLEQIERDIASGNPAHAYLMAGTNSVGKYTVAKKMASILQCENDFCQKCPTCIQIQKGSHIDTMEFKDRDCSIGIDEVKGIIERLNMTSQSAYKILLIQSIERMTMDAANSFLKTLEEPPSRTIIIMTTDNIRDILSTILSRVRIITFGVVSISYLTNKLRELFPESDEDTIKKVCLFSLGKTGKAVHLMRNPDSLANYLKVYHDIQNFLDHKNIVDRFSYVEDLMSDHKQIEVFFNILSHVLRSKLLSENIDAQRLKYINTLSKIADTGILLKRNVNQRLFLENLMLSL